MLKILEYSEVATEVASPNSGFVVAAHCQMGDEVQVGKRLIDVRPV